MRKHLKCALLFISLLVLIIGCSEKAHKSTKLTKDELATGDYSDEVLLHLNSRAQQLDLLFHNSAIVETLLQADKALKSKEGMSEALYQSLDQQMQQQRQTHTTQLLLYNACAMRLKQFQSAHPAFAEIFITDVAGMNVCQTNMTSDFYQADEDWWQKAYNGGKGRLYYGDIEYDQSAYSIAIPIYIPIYHKGEVIGISKSILTIDDITRSNLHR
ncbi:hypothetical protein [Facilibium subflavum]|uniref:hypothetical protein n=1 Tax=Facilibium subflavum TaxID=2219058 RepID=UPI000E64A7B1|nr:hypothetical protein [Facilibium subflavum]